MCYFTNIRSRKESKEGKEGKEGKEKGTDEPGEPTDKEGEKGKESEESKDPKGQQRKIEVNFSDTIQKISESTDVPPSILTGVFRSVANGALFLETNNFEKIKQDLGLPSSMTATELSQQIINAK